MATIHSSPVFGLRYGKVNSVATFVRPTLTHSSRLLFGFPGYQLTEDGDEMNVSTWAFQRMAIRDVLLIFLFGNVELTRNVGLTRNYR